MPNSASVSTLASLRDTLPYFLGAASTDDIRKREELRRAQHDLRAAERELERAGRVINEGLANAWRW